MILLKGKKELRKIERTFKKETGSTTFMRKTSLRKRLKKTKVLISRSRCSRIEEIGSMNNDPII